MWRKLRLVLWKNLIIRKRHWFLTFVEILIPILLFSMVAYGRSRIKGLNKIHIEESTYYDTNTEEYIYSHLDVGELHLWYSPSTNFTDSIIKKIQQKLQIRGDVVQEFKSQNELLHYFERNDSVSLVAAIVFKGDDHLHLNYDLTISDKHLTWDTDKLFLPSFTPEDARLSKYLYKGYAALQLAIDMSYIELYTDHKNVAFSIQEFPDPPRTIDSGVNQLFMYFLPLITIFSFIFLCPAVLQRVGEEKSSGTKEYMKMVGLKSWMIWLGWFIHALTTNLFSIVIVVILMKVSFWGAPYPPIEYADGTILFLFLFMYCMAAVTFCFLIASIFNTPSIATVIGILVWIFSYFVPQTLVNSYEYLQWKWKILFAVFPNMALHYGYSAISVYEMREVGIQWHNVLQPGNGDENDITMGNIFFMLIFDMCIFMLLTLYIENVKPGEYGIAKPYNFPLTDLKELIKKFVKRCFTHRVEDKSEIESLNDVEVGKKETCIKIRNLCKMYHTRVAVENLDMDIYKNCITVLLGQNGAGKTTIMSILTGMIEATSGVVNVNGKDIKKHTNKVRRMMGLCTQHNLLFPDLTVMEHLQLFAMLKGSTCPGEEAKKFLQKLGIDDKKDSMPNTLSGGMKRKLCLGMALIGNSEVLILDEPTSGMDPESRRKIWNLLLEVKKSKTILITTHFMEEADVLGERIAIMANGNLLCCNTPSVLKAKYNTGYHVSLLLESKIRLRDISELVKRHFVEGKLIRENEDFVVYLLPIEADKTKYKNLMKALEESQEFLNIIAINLNETTLNDVFLKAKDEVDGDHRSDNSSLSHEDVPSPTLQGMSREMNNFVTLIIKRWYFLKRKFYWFLPAILVAIAIFTLSIWLALSNNSDYDTTGPSISLTLKTYGKPKVYYGGHNTSNYAANNMKKYYSEEVLHGRGHPLFQEVVSNALIESGVENIASYKRHMIVAAEFNYSANNNQIIVNSMYSPEAVHSIPISINLAMNAILKTLINNSFSISISNTPLQPPTSQNAPSELSVINVTSVWVLLIPLSMFFFMSNFIVFPNSEVSTDFLQIQTIAGIKIYLYWITNIIFDFIFSIPPFIVLLFVLFVVNCVLYNSVAFGEKEFEALWLIFMTYIFVSLPFTYLLSYRKTITGGFSLLVMFGIFAGIIPTLVVTAMEFSRQDYYQHIAECLKLPFIILSPHFALSYIIVKFSKKYVENFNWQFMDTEKRSHICRFQPNPCCYGNDTADCSKYRNYFSNEELSVSYDLLLMLSSFVLYLFILCILNTQFLKKVVHFFKYFTCNGFNRIKNPSVEENDTLCVDNLTKSFGRKKIVKGLKFGLKKNQCFGLLGVNGAGKSTTFRMLTKYIFFDAGSIAIAKKKSEPISISNDEYCDKIGYCPQEDCLNYYLTSKELLLTVARLKGYSPDKANDIIAKLLVAFDLEKYADKPCLEYSGGNKRKLSSSLAFIGSPKVILLDEPTSGVDPASRQKFWGVLSAFKKIKDTSFLLCSHSMEECENLCDEIAIMKDGEIEAQGSLLHLKNEYQKGFKVTVKFASDATNTEVIEKEIASHLKAKVLEKYADSITFQVDDCSKRLSGLFDTLEELKCRYEAIEDYVINQISLEDIFLRVAEEKKSK